MTFEAAFLAAGAAFFAVVGAALAACLPEASRKLASRKKDKLDEWNDFCAEGYAAFKEAEGREPDAKRRGTDEACWGRWRDDVRRVAGLKQLSPARAAQAVELGVLAPEAGAGACAEWPGEMPEPSGEAGCNLLGAVCGALAFASAAHGGMQGAQAWIYALLALLCLAACVVAWQVDTARRIIPWECAAAVAAMGAAGRIVQGGLPELAWALPLALIAVAAFKGACMLEKALRGGTAVGGGDVRFAAAAALACGTAGILPGLLAAVAAWAATWQRGRRAEGMAARETARLMLPMGPALSATAAVGMAAAPLVQAML